MNCGRKICAGSERHYVVHTALVHATQSSLDKLPSTNSNFSDLAILINCVGRKLVLKQRVEEEAEVIGQSWQVSIPNGEICPFTPGVECDCITRRWRSLRFRSNDYSDGSSLSWKWPAQGTMSRRSDGRINHCGRCIVYSTPTHTIFRRFILYPGRMARIHSHGQRCLSRSWRWSRDVGTLSWSEFTRNASGEECPREGELDIVVQPYDFSIVKSFADHVSTHWFEAFVGL